MYVQSTVGHRCDLGMMMLEVEVEKKGKEAMELCVEGGIDGMSMWPDLKLQVHEQFGGPSPPLKSRVPAGFGR